MGDIILKVLLLGLILTILGTVYHLFKLATSASYREKSKIKNETHKRIRNKIKTIETISNYSELQEIIYDPYNEKCNIFEFNEFKLNLIDFENENSIVNLIYDSFYTNNLLYLEGALKKIKKNISENEAIIIYLEIIKEIEKEKDKVNQKRNDFKNNYKKIITAKLLERRKKLLKNSIDFNKQVMNRELLEFKLKNSINEETFSFINITNKINFKDGYNNFLTNFISEFKSLETNIKDIVKFEIIDEFNYNTRKEFKL